MYAYQILSPKAADVIASNDVGRIGEHIPSVHNLQPQMIKCQSISVTRFDLFTHMFFKTEYYPRHINLRKYILLHFINYTSVKNEHSLTG